MDDFSALGGHRALDLVNTVSWRLDAARADEDLIDYGALLAWSRQFELLSAAEVSELRSQAREHPRLAQRAYRDAVARSSWLSSWNPLSEPNIRPPTPIDRRSAPGDHWRCASVS